jgi:hypothetical protein
MIRALVDMRGLTAMAIAAATGVWGVTAYPPAADNVFLQLIALREPVIFRALMHGYAALWFSTSFMAASLVLSVAAIVVYRRPPAARTRALPRYPKPETRPAPALVLGETHHHTTPGRAPQPTWLTIPQRGLYTGVMILGAVFSVLLARERRQRACTRMLNNSCGGARRTRITKLAVWSLK